MNNNKKNFIILGGGAAGILLAMKLAPKKQKMNINITLVDCKSFFEYTPSLISVLYESTDEQFETHFNNITRDYKTLLEPLGIKFKLGVVHDLNNENVLIFNNNDQEIQRIPYDIVVICTGSSYSDPWKIPFPSCQQNNTPMIQWRNDRFNFLCDQREKYKTSNKILCIGAGAVGTELVTEIAYRSPEKEIILVNGSSKVLSGTPQDLMKSGERILNTIPSIQLIHGEHAEHINDNAYKTDRTNTEIKNVDLVYQCTGIQPNTQFLQKSHSDWLDDKNYIRVNEFFQVEQQGEKHIFAIGDVNNIREPKLWFTAHIQTIHLFHQLERLLLLCSNDGYSPYQGSKLSMLISMGPYHGIGSFNDGITVLNGWPFNKDKGSKLAAIIKHIIERVTMNDFHSKKIMNDVLYNTHEKGHWIPKIIDKLTHSSPFLDHPSSS